MRNFAFPPLHIGLISLHIGASLCNHLSSGDHVARGDVNESSALLDHDLIQLNLGLHLLVLLHQPSAVNSTSTPSFSTGSPISTFHFFT